MFLKDDNLGLGAKRGSERAENFGLAGLASILGRLNGNEEAVKKEEERQEEIEKRAFVYRKYGMMNFVSGGYLVGDKITKKADIKLEPEVKVEIKTEPESDDGKVGKKDKKRKRLEVEAVEVRTDEEPKLKRKKKSVDLREEARNEDESESSKAKKDKKDKKEKKDKSKKSKKSASSDPEPMSSGIPTPASDPEALTDKARRKAEKKAGKEEKKLKKALKKAAKEAAKSNGDAEESSSDSDEDESTPSASTPTSVPATGTSTPSGLVFAPRGMHAVRQRWIRQKKAATMDAQAMKEVRSTPSQSSLHH